MISGRPARRISSGKAICSRSRLSIAADTAAIGGDAVRAREVVGHVGQEHGHVHYPVPRRAGVLEDQPHVVEHRERLQLDVVRRDLAVGAEHDAAALARVREWVRGGHATVTDQRVRLTAEGWLLLDRLAVEFDLGRLRLEFEARTAP